MVLFLKGLTLAEMLYAFPEIIGQKPVIKHRNLMLATQ